VLRNLAIDSCGEILVVLISARKFRNLLTILNYFRLSYAVRMPAEAEQSYSLT